MPKYFSYLLFVLATLGLFSNMLPACEGDAWSDDKRLSRFSEPIETSDGKQPSFAEERKIYVERFRDNPFGEGFGLFTDESRSKICYEGPRWTQQDVRCIPRIE